VWVKERFVRESFDGEPTATALFDREPQATASFNGEPTATVLFDREPQATASFNGEPTATVLFDREPQATASEISTPRGTVARPPALNDALPPGAGSSGRIFIPSRLDDNPHLDADGYRRSLAHLPAVTRERLLNGDWNIAEAGPFRAEWLRYYVLAKRRLVLLDPAGRTLAALAEGSCRRYVTVDPAGTSADAMRQARGRPASWTVAQVWDQPRRGELARLLVLRDQVRQQVGFAGLCRLLREVYDRWRPERLWIEDEKLGRAAVDLLQRALPIATIPTQSRDKLTRASALALKLEAGEIFLPRYENSWRHEFEAELLAWTGRDDQPADQIDAAAYAALLSRRFSAGPVTLLAVARS
jgi:predicted phage terminase large subunit-like protein